MVPHGTVQCMLFGFGSDGTVGANQNAIKLISQETKMQTQGHFAYDALKAGGVTCGCLRFGPNLIKESYEIAVDCMYLAMQKKEGGIFVLNSPWTTLEH